MFRQFTLSDVPMNGTAVKTYFTVSAYIKGHYSG